MIHNEQASTLAMCRSLRQDLDPSQPSRTVPMATLILILDTLIELGTPAQVDRLNDAAGRTVMGHITERNQNAEAARENWQKPRKMGM